MSFVLTLAESQPLAEWNSWLKTKTQTQLHYQSSVGPVESAVWKAFISCNSICSRDLTYIRTHRQPELLSFPSLSLPPCFANLASSSSTMSCGLTVMWTTLGVSFLNLILNVQRLSAVRTSRVTSFDNLKWLYLPESIYRLVICRSVWVGLNSGWTV
jgi:hypothetical protein